MVGGIVVTHAGFAEGIKEAVEMIAGKQECFEAIGLREGGGMEQLLDEIRKTAEEMSCEKIWIFCDMFGATPSNVSCVLAVQNDYNVITGVNLPLLLEFVMGRLTSNDEELQIDIERVSQEDFRWITKKDLL